MELRHLRTFLVVAETLNISEAGRRLHVTQPALSRQIRDLEHAVGHALFVRHANGLRLTATGKTLRAHGAKAVAAIDDALQRARGTAVQEPATLRVGYYGGVSIWAAVLAPAIKKFGRKFPRLNCKAVELSGSQMVKELREGRLDAAVLGPGDYPRLRGVTIEEACVVPGWVMVPLNHRLAKKRLIALEDLRGEEVISLTRQVAPGRDRSFIAACRAAGFSPRMVNVAASLPDAILALTARMGVGIIGSFAMKQPHPGTVFIKLRPPGVPLTLFAAHTSSSAAARHLAELIVAEARRAARDA